MLWGLAERDLADLMNMKSKNLKALSANAERLW